MTTQFIVVRASYPTPSIYIECEGCWMININEPDRVSTHCLSLSAAKQVANQLDEEAGSGSRSQHLDCAHAKADGSD